jgi:hypothetical protein
MIGADLDGGAAPVQATRAALLQGRREARGWTSGGGGCCLVPLSDPWSRKPWRAIEDWREAVAPLAI